MSGRLSCGHPRPPVVGCSDGVGHAADGRTYCPECCASRDVGAMLKDGNSRRLPLYFDGKAITNWPGSLRITAFGTRCGRHNIAGSRVDVWFIGPDRYYWHGVQYGKNRQVLHARRTKERPKGGTR